MFVIRRFIFLLACFLLLGKDVTYAYSLSHKLELQLKQKRLKNGENLINPSTINDSAKFLLVEIEEIEDDSTFCFGVSYKFPSSTYREIGCLFSNTSLLFALVINRVILFCTIKIDC
jgi:hypothetical protein